jgi:hypothetical protein
MLTYITIIPPQFMISIPTQSMINIRTQLRTKGQAS